MIIVEALTILGNRVTMFVEPFSGDYLGEYVLTLPVTIVQQEGEGGGDGKAKFSVLSGRTVTITLIKVG